MCAEDSLKHAVYYMRTQMCPDLPPIIKEWSSAANLHREKKIMQPVLRCPSF